MNTFQEWFIRALRLPPRGNTLREFREYDRTLDDAQSNAPPRQKQAARRAPERK